MVGRKKNGACVVLRRSVSSSLSFLARKEARRTTRVLCSILRRELMYVVQRFAAFAADRRALPGAYLGIGSKVSVVVWYGTRYGT